MLSTHAKPPRSQLSLAFESSQFRHQTRKWKRTRWFQSSCQDQLHLRWYREGMDKVREVMGRDGVECTGGRAGLELAQEGSRILWDLGKVRRVASEKRYSVVLVSWTQDSKRTRFESWLCHLLLTWFNLSLSLPDCKIEIVLAVTSQRGYKSEMRCSYKTFSKALGTK